MNETNKLRVLISHWIEHNEGYADEFRHWAECAGEAAPEILAAANIMIQANALLDAALEKLGGPLDYQHAH